MSYNVLSVSPFDRQLKRLSKKYPSLKKEIAGLFDSLEKNPFQGTSLGNHCFKIRMAIASKGKGKSGGARIITHVAVLNQSVYLLSIYDKSEVSAISDVELKDLVKQIR